VRDFEFEQKVVEVVQGQLGEELVYDKGVASEIESEIAARAPSGLPLRPVDLDRSIARPLKKKDFFAGQFADLSKAECIERVSEFYRVYFQKHRPINTISALVLSSAGNVVYCLVMTWYHWHPSIRDPALERRIREFHSRIVTWDFAFAEDLSERAAGYLLIMAVLETGTKLRTLLCPDLANARVRVYTRETEEGCLKAIEDSFRKQFLDARDSDPPFNVIGIAAVRVGRLVSSLVLYGTRADE
jgi:hypothetical protein